MNVFRVIVESKRGQNRRVSHHYIEAENYSQAGSRAVAGECIGKSRWRDEDRTSAEDSTEETHTWEDSDLVAPEDVWVIRKYHTIHRDEDCASWELMSKQFEGTRNG